MDLYDRIIETLILLAVVYEAFISRLHYEHSVFRAKKRRLTRFLNKLLREEK